MAYYKEPQPLWNFLEEYREDGVDVAAFPTSKGDRFALRLVDPDDKETGLVHIASFAKSLEEASRPSDPREQTRRNQALNSVLSDAKKAAKYVVCFCVIDQDSVDGGFAEEKDLGKTFKVVATQKASKSDAYRVYDETKAEAKVKKVSKK